MYALSHSGRVAEGLRVPVHGQFRGARFLPQAEAAARGGVFNVSPKAFSELGAPQAHSWQSQPELINARVSHASPQGVGELHSHGRLNMLTHPFIRQPVSPLMRGGGMVRPGGMGGLGGAMRPVGPVPIHPMGVGGGGLGGGLGGQRAEVGLALARQRALAGALRGGSPGGVPPPPANPAIMRPAGIPQVR